MQKQKSFLTEYKFGICVFVLLMLKPIAESLVLDYTFARWLTLLVESVLISLLCCRFVAAFGSEKAKGAKAFAAIFAAWFFSFYNYNLYSAIEAENILYSVCFLIFLASFLCLCFESTSALAAVLGIVGVVISGDYAVMFMPSLIVAALLTVNAAPQKAGKKQKAKGSSGFVTRLSMFTAPALIITQLWAVISYFFADEFKFGRQFYAEKYFFELNGKKLVAYAFVLALAFIVWQPRLKNRKSIACFAGSVAAIAVTLVSAYLLDFTKILFGVYSLSAVIGLFFTMMAVAVRGGKDSAVEDCVTNRMPALLVVTFLCVAYSAQFTMAL